MECFDENICTSAINSLPEEEQPISNEQQQIISNEHHQTISNEQQTCSILQDNPCDKISSESETKELTTSDQPRPDIIVYNDELYNKKKQLQQQGKQLVNYITLNSIYDLERFKINYPNAFNAFLESNKDLPTWYTNKYHENAPPVSTFVYIPK
jgi:glycerol-3-phosphate cytidylyltransferase-like family protein